MPLGIVIIGNLTAIIMNRGTAIDYIMYVGIFIPIILLLILFPRTPKNRTISIILLILSCIGVWFGGDTNLVSATLFCFAIYIFRSNRRIIYIYSGCLILSVILKFTIMGLNIPQFFVIMAGSAFIIILYQHYIHPKSDNKITVICPELDSETVKILQNLYEGCSVKEIGSMLYLSEAAVQKRIGRAKIAMNARSREHLLALCREKGYIGLNVDNLT